MNEFAKLVEQRVGQLREDSEAADPVVASFRDLLQGHGYQDSDTMNVGWQGSHFHQYSHPDHGYEFKWAHGMRKPYWFLGKKDEFFVSGYDFLGAQEALRRLHKPRRKK